MNTDRLRVNASIEKLIKGTENWRDEALVIIAAFAHLSKTSSIAVEGSISFKSKDESVTGYSPGVGNTELRDKGTNKRKEFQFGMPRERVGYYKVSKPLEGVLRIRHWWKSDIGTRSPNESSSPSYYLGFDVKTLDPEYFSFGEDQVIFELFGIQFFKELQRVIYGKLKYKSICSHISWRPWRK